MAKKAKEPEKESANDKFVRLAVARMKNFKTQARLVCNLTGPGYSFTPEQRDKLVGEVFRLANEIKTKFEAAGKAKTNDDSFAF